jgi:two-component sensor histidine kinase
MDPRSVPVEDPEPTTETVLLGETVSIRTTFTRLWRRIGSTQKTLVAASCITNIVVMPFFLVVCRGFVEPPSLLVSYTAIIIGYLAVNVIGLMLTLKGMMVARVGLTILLLGSVIVTLGARMVGELGPIAICLNAGTITVTALLFGPLACAAVAALSVSGPILLIALERAGWIYQTGFPRIDETVFGFGITVFFSLMALVSGHMGSLVKRRERGLGRLREQTRFGTILRAKDQRIAAQDEALEAMDVVGSIFISVTDLELILNRTLELLVNAVGGTRASVMLYEEFHGFLQVRAGINLPAAAWDQKVALGKGVAGYVAEKRDPILVEDASGSGELPGFDLPPGASFMSVPLLFQEKLLGVVNISDKRTGGRFTEDDFAFFRALANHMAVAIHNTQLAEAALKAERLAAIGEAVAGLAHGVKNMLNGLQGGFYMVKTGLQDGTGEIPGDAFEMLDRNLKRLNDLVHDMLSYSKDRAPEYEQADLNEVVGSAVALMQARAKERSLDLRFHPSGERTDVRIDSKGVYRCVLNLIGNALDACDREGAAVDVKTDTSDDARVTIEVADEGAGMDEATRKSVFKPFFSRKGSAGTGLGLSVASKIVEEHGGTIEVESSPGEGSTFRICLPL